MTDVREGEGGKISREEAELQQRPLDIMQKAQLARGGQGAIESVDTQKFAKAAEGDEDTTPPATRR